MKNIKTINQLFIVLSCSLILASPVHSQPASPAKPWFGISLPPTLVPHGAPAAIGERGPVPAVIPAGEESHIEFRGQRILEDLQRIVDFSYDSLRRRELGGTQIWGRVSGFRSGEETIQWAAEQLLEAGIEDVRRQRFQQEEGTEIWIPKRWEMRLHGNTVFGMGSEDVVLESAMVLAPSEISGTLTAPIVYVGKASAAELMHIDVEGKIAIQHITPQGHTVFERSTAGPAANRLSERGAVAVINLIDQPGNEMARDFSNCGSPCFNVGGRDSYFLSRVMDAAAEAGSFNELRVSLSASSEAYSGLDAINAVAVIPGSGSEETIVINAHADAWFDGAGDNGDGLAVLLSLGRHFAKPENQLNRTLVLVVSAGHHSRGLNGPRNAVSMNPDLFGNALLVFNLEHIGQRNIAPARFLFADGYRQYSADSGEAPIVVGISNESAYLQNLFTQGVARYGTNFMSTESTMASGEGGGYRSAAIPIVTTMQAPPLYHTSGEVTEVISVPGLERMARFMGFFIRSVDRAEQDQIGTGN